jgi:hypothetical protein
VIDLIVVSASKSYWMLYRTGRMPNFTSDLQYNNVIIKQTDSFKYLGVRMDPKLYFEDQYNYVLSNMLSRIKHISRYKIYFMQRQLKIFSNSLVLSLLDYCLPVWGFLCNTKIERLDNVIMNMIENVILSRRVKYNEKWLVHERCNILTVEERRNVYSLNFIFKHVICETSLSDTMRKIFVIKPNYMNLRDAMKFVVPKPSRSFSYHCIQLWNDLPVKIKNLKSFTIFDREIRQHFILQRKDFHF